MTIEPFSNGYVRTSLYLEPYAAGPVLDVELYDYLDAWLYAETDNPVTVRVGLQPGPYFSVEGEAGVPPDVLAVPEDWLVDLPAESFHEQQDVFVVRPGFRSGFAAGFDSSFA